ncbi:MAG: type III pantothenate kinase [Myxococcales bacterium]|nr:type III pantothenate kinase [Myxococcales bacterium]
MLLAIDVGNTNTSLGVFEGDALRCELRLSTQRAWTRDEAAIALERALALADLRFADLGDAVIASVVPPALAPLCRALSRYAGVDALVIEPGVDTGMPILYNPPQDVGADRIVTAVAAHRRYGAGPDGEPRGVIVVDFGTATTFDVVTPTPEYLGGVIAPGVGISADALFSRTSKLPRVEIRRPQGGIVGRTTVGAIQSGLFYGYVGLVEGILGRLQSALEWPSTVIATGGLASEIARDTDRIDAVDDALILEGLRVLHARLRGERGAGASAAG